MQWYENEVRTLERARAAGGFRTHAPVFYGSSSMRLWKTLAEDVSPAVQNVAFGGSTLEACDFFFERLVTPLAPSSLVIYAGDNDLGDGRKPEQVFGYFVSILAKAERLKPAQFGFMSIKPSPARWPIVDRIRRANRLIKEEIARHPGAYYIDVFDAMLDAKGRARPELFESDGLHMNRSGYRLWAEILTQYRNKIFADTSSAE